MKNKKLIFFGALAIGGLIATAVTTTWGSFKAAKKIREEKPETNIFGNEDVKKLFDDIESMLGRNMSSTELTEILSWIEDDNIAPEITTELRARRTALVGQS